MIFVEQFGKQWTVLCCLPFEAGCVFACCACGSKMSQSDGTGNIHDTSVNRTGILAEMLSCEPQANSTVFEGIQRDMSRFDPN